MRVEPVVRTALIVLWTSCLCASDNEDLFSSVFELERLYRTELEFSNALFKYLQEEKSSPLSGHDQIIKEFLDSAYPEGPIKPVPNPEEFISNPLNALGIMRRLGWFYISTGMQSIFSQNEAPDLTDQARLQVLRDHFINTTDMFPTLDNYHDALGSVTLLQEAYQLNITALAEGIVQISGTEARYQSAFVPNWSEMNQLATGASNKGWWDTGMTWFQQAMERALKEGLDNEADPEWVRFLEKFEQGKRIHDQILDVKGQFGFMHRTLPLPFSSKLRKKKKYKKAKKGEFAKQTRDYIPLLTVPEAELKDRRMQENYLELCRRGNHSDEIPRPPDQLLGLECRYQHHNDPYLRLAPFKLEEASREPYVVQVHEFMHDTEMEYFRTWAGPRLFRSETGGLTTKQLRIKTRTSKQAWLHERFFRFRVHKSVMDNEEKQEQELGKDPSRRPPMIPFNPMSSLNITDEVAFRVTLRIQNFTRMELRLPFASEGYQVANYGMGGQYETHLDANGFHEDREAQFLSSQKESYYSATGDRLSTFMVYLSDVTYGGRTVFPLLGLSSEPRKGTAIFWMNLNPRGNRNKLTYHGGCPVLLGSKWITNKWIGYHDQMFKQQYRCGLHPEEKWRLWGAWRGSR